MWSRVVLVLIGVALIGGVSARVAAATVPSDAIRSSYDDDGRLRSLVAPDFAGGARAPREAAVFGWDPVGNLLSIDRYDADALSIVGATPERGRVGDTVEIAGTGFGGDAEALDVRFAGTAARVLDASDERLRVEVPSGASTGSVSVALGRTTVTSADPFTVETDAAPVIDSVTPDVAGAGDELTVAGDDFAAARADDDVRVNGIRALVSSTRASEIVTEAPPTGSGRLTVETPEGKASGPDVFVVPSPFAPADVEDTGRLAPGTSQAVDLSASGKVAMYVVDASRDDRIRTQVASGSLSGVVSVYSPTGAELSHDAFDGSASTTPSLQLPSDGTYTVLVSSTSAGSTTITPYVDGVTTIVPSPEGTTATVRTSFTGQSARLRFTGRAGERIAVRADSSTLDGWIEIVPAGTTSYLNPYGFLASSGWLDPITLPSDGSWDVWLETSQSGGGQADVTVYDVPDDQAEDVTISSTVVRRDLTFDYSGQNAQFDFDGTAGQRVELRFPSIDLAAFDARVETSGGSTVQSSSWTSSSDGFMEATLPADGRYRIVVDPSQADTGSVTMEAVDASDVVESITPTSSGVTRTLRTTWAGQDARLRIDGRAGQRIAVSVDSSTLDGWIELARAGTTEYLNPFSFLSETGWLDTMTLPRDGSWDVWLETSQSGGGQADVTVYDVPDDQTEDITLSPTIVRRDLRFDDPGQNARYTFDGRTGQRVNVQLPADTLDEVTARVVDSSGTTLGSQTWSSSGGDALEVVLPSDGRYSVVLDPTDGDTGTATVEIGDTGDVVESISPTSSGVTRTVRTSFSGQDARLRFTGRAGQRIAVKVDSSTLSGWIELAPAGTTYFAQPYTTFDDDGWLELTLPDDGSWDVWLETTQSGGGEADVTVYDVPDDQSDDLTLSTSATREDVRVDDPGQNVRYTFDGRAGQRVHVALTASTFDELTGRVVDSGGSTVSSQTWSSSGGDALDAVLPSDGTYTLVLDPTNGDTGTASVDVSDAGDVVQSITPTASGVTRTMRTLVSGQDARLRFDGRAGQRIAVKVDSSTLSGWIELAPAGTTYYVQPYATFATDGWVEVTLPDDGSWDVWLETTQSGGGAADVTVYDVPDDQSDDFTLSSTASREDVRFENPGQNARYTFDATAGQRVHVTFPSISLSSFSARVVDSSGSTISSSSWTSSSTGYMDAVLPSRGTYAIVVDPDDDSTGSVSMEAVDASDVVASITPTSRGVTRTLSTDYAGQDIRLRFDGTTDQQLSVDVSSSTLTGWIEFAPAGTTDYLSSWTSFGTSGSLGPVTIPSDGSWDVWLETNGGSGGELTVTVTDETEDGPEAARSGEAGGEARLATTQPSGAPLPAPLVPAAASLGAGGVRRSLGEQPRRRAAKLPHRARRQVHGHSRAAARALRRHRAAALRAFRAAHARARAKQREALAARRHAAARVRRAHAHAAAQHHASAGAGAAPRDRDTPGRSPRRSSGQHPAVATSDASESATAQRRLLRTLPRWDSSTPSSWRPTRADRHGAWTADAPPTPWTRLRPLHAAASRTGLSGQVLRVDGTPLRGVSVSIENASAGAQTDRTGRFLLTGLSAGRHVLVVDGQHVGGHRYGIYEVCVDLASGRTTVLPYTVWLTELDHAGDARVRVPTRRETVLTNPAIPGLEVHLPAGSRITDANGRAVRDLNLTAIPVDRPPFPTPDGVEVPAYFTAQPGRAYLSKGARIVYPNYTHLPPGQRVAFWNYDADDRGWYIYGYGAVTPDARQVVPDPGVRIWEFTGAMVTTSAPPPSSGPNAGGGSGGGDPVDLGTGLFVYQKTDLTLPDAISATVQRTYRPADSNIYTFGRGTTSPYDLRLWNVSSYSVAQIILPDGGTVRFDRTSPGNDWQGAVFEQRTTPGPWFGAVIRRMSNLEGWELRRRDGTIFQFGSGYGPVTMIQDPDGNQLTIRRSDGAAGLAEQVTTPHGHWLRFSYDRYDRATQVVDNAGRRLSYSYDGDSRLQTVTDADGGESTFTYDTSGRITAIEDARGTTFLQNRYDTDGRVSEQTLADRGPYDFDYTTDRDGKVTSTTVTDPRGVDEQVDFDAAGLPVSDTRAVGTGVEQTTRYERDARTNLVDAVVDPLGNRTEYDHDADSDVTSVTRLAGTRDAQTSRYTYDSDAQLLTAEDPAGNVTRYAYDSLGRLTSTTDPTSRTTTIGYANGQRQPAWIRDPAGAETQLSYVDGDLRSVTDPLGRVTKRWVDSVGRVVAITDPLGRTSRAVYDDANLLVATIDPRGGETTYRSDENGNLVAVTDPRGKTTRATYDLRDRLASWTDADGDDEQIERDLDGNATKVTDRKGQVTTYRYDELNRRTFAGFGTTGRPGSETYDSTIDYGYDDGDRLTELDDSATGDVTNDWDGLGRLTSQETPNGTVSYTYDDAGDREGMSLDGSSLAGYGYDDAGRLTSVVQDGGTTRLDYDSAGRQDSLELPDGVERQTTYDDAGQPTRLAWALGRTTLGDLQYAYDDAGHRTATWGTFARTRLPGAIRSATYDDANRLTALDGVTLRWDDDGNLTDDGTDTYAWDSRNQLTGVRDARGTIASFAYDPLGRRAGATLGGTSRSFVYDGWNVVKEDDGSTDTTLVNGLGLDQVFARTVGSTTRDVLADVLGSTVALADDRGAITDEFAYGPFGESDTSTDHPYQYTGRENDGTGLYQYRNRYYSPALKRFVSEDPTGMAGSGVNYYAYAGDDPLDNTDPTGLSFVSFVDSIVPNPVSDFAAGMFDGALAGIPSRALGIPQECWGSAHAYGQMGGAAAGAFTVAAGGTALATAAIGDGIYSSAVAGGFGGAVGGGWGTAGRNINAGAGSIARGAVTGLAGGAAGGGLGGSFGGDEGAAATGASAATASEATGYATGIGTGQSVTVTVGPKDHC